MANEIKIAGKMRSATTEGILADAAEIQQGTGLTVEQAIKELDDKATAADSDISNLNANTGISDYEEFSDQKEYKAGTTVLKDGLLKTFITDHAAGAWDDEEVENFTFNRLFNSAKYSNAGLSCVKELYVLSDVGYEKGYEIRLLNSDEKSIISITKNEEIIARNDYTYKKQGVEVISIREQNESDISAYAIVNWDLVPNSAIKGTMNQYCFSLDYNLCIKNYINSFIQKTEFDELNEYISKNLSEILPIKIGGEIVKNEDIEYQFDDSSINNRDIYLKKLEISGFINKIEVLNKTSTSCHIALYSVDKEMLSYSVIHDFGDYSLNSENAINTIQIEDEFAVKSGYFIGIQFNGEYLYKKDSSAIPREAYRIRNNQIIAATTSQAYYVYIDKGVYDYDVFKELPSCIENSKDALSKANKLNWERLYNSTDFSDWENEDYNSAGTWTKQDNTITPTAFGGYVDNKLSATIAFKKAFESSWKHYKIVSTLNTDTVLNIHFFRTSQTGQLPNESLYRINCAEKQLQILRNYNRYIQENVVFSKSFGDFEIIDGRKYIIEILQIDYVFVFKITDYLNGKNVSLEISKTWDGGTLKCYLGFSVKSGGHPVIHKVSIYEPTDLTAVLVGDSITEGYGLSTTPTKKYSSLMIDRINNSIVSAASSDTLDNIIDRFDNELKLNKPKYIICTIGTNNGNGATKEKFQQLFEKCSENGIKLILNHVPCSTTLTTFNDVNKRIDELDLDGAKFDIATAVNNNPEEGANSELFIDGTHPTIEGHELLYERTIVDLGFLYN